MFRVFRLFRLFRVFRCLGLMVQVFRCLGVWVFRLMTFGKDQKGDQGVGPKLVENFGWGKTRTS